MGLIIKGEKNNPKQMKRILIINHHDSFVYNLVQIIRERTDCSYKFINTEDLDENLSLLKDYEYILLSPGPGHPEEFPHLIPTILRCVETHSILGVCLGMQAIALAFGGKIECLPKPKHGHKSRITISDNGSRKLFEGLSAPIFVARYHSWIVSKEHLPSCLSIDAYDEELNIAALSHKKYPICGVQFHPESVITEQGRAIIDNWLK